MELDITINEFKKFLADKPEGKSVIWKPLGDNWSPLEPFLCRKLKKKIKVELEWIADADWNFYEVPQWINNFHDFFQQEMLNRLAKLNKEVAEQDEKEKLMTCPVCRQKTDYDNIKYHVGTYDFKIKPSITELKVKHKDVLEILDNLCLRN